MVRLFVLLSGLMGLTGVALGAFGAHGLKNSLGHLEDFPQRIAWWETAAHYHLIHSLALLGTAFVLTRVSSAAATLAGYAFALGICLFSGSLYVMTLTGMRQLGAVTPLGGLCFLLGWACLCIAAYGMTPPPAP